MRAWLWGAAAAVSVTAHVAFAAWVEAREPAPRTQPRPPVVMELAAVARPKPVEPPKPPPPPPPPPKPVTIKKVAKHPPAAPPPPPEAPRFGSDAPDTPGGLPVPKGDTMDADPVADGQGKEPAPPAPPPPPPAPPAPPAKKFLPAYEVTQLPRPKHRVEPEIPEAFRQAQREALVVVELEIDARGKVVSARVLRHAEYGLDDAALAAARQTEFEPALMGTTPVAVRYQIPYRFRVRG